MARKSAEAASDRQFFQPHRRHRSRRRGRAPPACGRCASWTGSWKATPRSERSSSAGRQRQRIRPLEAGIQQLLAAAIGEGAGSVAAPHHQRFAPGAQKRIALAHRAAGAGAGDAQGAPQALGAALFRQRPKRGGDRQRHRAGRQGAQHDQPAAIESDDQIDRIGCPGGGRQGHRQGDPKPRPNAFRSVPNWDSCPACPLKPAAKAESLLNQQDTGRGPSGIGIVVNKV